MVISAVCSIPSAPRYLSLLVRSINLPERRERGLIDRRNVQSDNATTDVPPYEINWPITEQRWRIIRFIKSDDIPTKIHQTKK